MESPVVLFDGVCNLCTASVRFLLRYDQRRVLRFASLQSSAGRRLLVAREAGALAEVGPEGGTFVLVEGDRVRTRSDAALRVAVLLGGLWRLFAVLRAIPRPLRDAVYDTVARRRYRWFGRRESCLLPTPELRGRFLDED